MNQRQYAIQPHQELENPTQPIDISRLLNDTERNNPYSSGIIAEKFIKSFGTKTANEAIAYIMENNLVDIPTKRGIFDRPKELHILPHLLTLRFEYETMHRRGVLRVYEYGLGNKNIYTAVKHEHFKSLLEITSMYIAQINIKK